MGQKIKKVLVVDDSRLARMALSKQLQRLSIEVETAGDGTEAIEYLHNAEPDLVFMDFMMPDVDGFEATRRIFADPACSKPPVVMYTSQDTPEDRARAQEIGISGFLTKPSSDDSLAAVIAQIERGDVSTPVSASAPPAAPADAPPAMAPSVPKETAVPPVSLPWDEIRAAARDAAQSVAQERAESVARERLESFRKQLDEDTRAAVEQARQVAEEAARTAAEAAARDHAERVASGVAEQSARQAAQEASEQAAGRQAREAAKDAVRDASAELGRDVDQRLEQFVHGSDFKTQVKGVVFEHALPGIHEAVLPVAQQKAEQAVQQATQPLADKLRELESKLAEAQAQASAAQAGGGRSVGVAVLAGLVAGAVAGVLAVMLF